MIDSPTEPRAHLFEEIADLLADRLSTHRDHLDGQQSGEDTVLLGHMTSEAQTCALFTDQKGPARGQMFTEKLKPYRGLIQGSAMKRAEGIEQMRRRYRSTDPAGKPPFLEQIIGKNGEEEIRLDENTTGIDDTESIPITIRSDPEVESLTTYDLRERL